MEGGWNHVSTTGSQQYDTKNLDLRNDPPAGFPGTTEGNKPFLIAERVLGNIDSKICSDRQILSPIVNVTVAWRGPWLVD